MYPKLEKYGAIFSLIKRFTCTLKISICNIKNSTNQFSVNFKIKISSTKSLIAFKESWNFLTHRTYVNVILITYN